MSVLYETGQIEMSNRRMCVEDVPNDFAIIQIGIVVIKLLRIQTKSALGTFRKKSTDYPHKLVITC